MLRRKAESHLGLSAAALKMKNTTEELGSSAL